MKRRKRKGTKKKGGSATQPPATPPPSQPDSTSISTEPDESGWPTQTPFAVIHVNLPESTSTAPHSGESGSSLSKPKRRLLVAVLTLLASLLIAATTFVPIVFRPTEPKPEKPKPEKPTPRNQKPHVSTKIVPPTIVLLSATDRYTYPPEMEAVADDDEPLSRKALQMYVMRTVFCPRRKGQATAIPNKYMEFRAENGKRRLIGIPDMPRLLSTKTPFGRYVAWAAIVDRRGVRSVSQKVKFDYVFRTTFEPMEVFLTPDDNTAFSSSKDCGLKIVNSTLMNGSVSGVLRQAFDQNTNLAIMGRFTIKSLPRNPAGLEVNLGNMINGRIVGKIAFIFPDAQGHVAIKFLEERRMSTDVVGKLPERSRIKTDGSTPYYFIIQIVKERSGVSRYEIYISNTPLTDVIVNPAAHSPLHMRRYSTSKLLDGLTRIRIRAWRKGVIRLHYLEVFELPDASDGKFRGHP